MKCLNCGSLIDELNSLPSIDMYECPACNHLWSRQLLIDTIIKEESSDE